MSEEREDYFDAYDQGEALERDAPYDAGDRKAVTEKEKAYKRLEASKRMVIRQIMGTSEGRAWMNGILVLCNVFDSSFSTSALTMAYLEGKREIGLRLIADVVNAAPSRYTEMRKEANDE
jgi:hypothetical protein